MHLSHLAATTFAALALTATLSVTLAPATFAQSAPSAITAGAANIKRTPLQKFDVPGTNSETITAVAEIVPNVLIGKHMHFGIETGYVLSGDVVLMVAGQPDLALKAGDSYQIPANAPHDAKSGANGTKLLAVYIVEKGKPLATPVQ